MIYSIVLLVLFFSLIFHFFKIRRCLKHDTYLYQFCKLRRDVMQYLRNNHDIISNKEYKDIKYLLDVLNRTISLYSKYKTILFNFRIFVRLLSHTKDLSDDSRYIFESNNETIKNFSEELDCVIIKSFFAYTPFFRHEIFIKLFILLTSTLIKIGFNKLKNLNRKIPEVIESYRDLCFRLKQIEHPTPL